MTWIVIKEGKNRVMYGGDCPYCEKEDLTMEAEGMHGYYVGRPCQNCGEVYYILQRSWFDVTYDTSDVPAYTQADMSRLVKNKRAKLAGGHKTDKRIKLYIPIYTKKQQAERERALEINKKVWKV